MNLQRLGDKQFFKKVLAIGFPIALQNLFVNSATMIDTVMISTAGERAVSAVGISSEFAALFFSAFFGFTAGGILFFAQYHGEKNEKGITKAYGVALSCMMVVGLVFGGIAVIAPEMVLGVYTDKESIIQIGAPYMRILGLSLPLQTLNMAMSSLLRSTERVRAPLFAGIAAQVVNFCVNALLIFGLFGCPKLGVTGAAIGTLAAGIVNTVILYAYCVKQGVHAVTRLREQFLWDMGFIKLYFRKCLPMIANEVLYGVGQLAINMVVGRQEESAIAAMAVFRTVERLIFAFFSGFTNASAVIVGNQVGGGQLKGAYRDAWRFTFWCPVVTCAVCVLVCFVRVPLLGLFGLQDKAMEYGMYMLAFYILSGTLRTCNYIINDTFRASGETVFGTVTELSCLYFITVPTVLVSGLVLHLPFLVIFSLIFIDDLVRIPIMLLRVKSGKWIKPVTDKGKAALPAFREERKRDTIHG